MNCKAWKGYFKKIIKEKIMTKNKFENIIARISFNSDYEVEEISMKNNLSSEAQKFILSGVETTPLTKWKTLNNDK